VAFPHLMLAARPVARTAHAAVCAFWTAAFRSRPCPVRHSVRPLKVTQTSHVAESTPFSAEYISAPTTSRKINVKIPVLDMIGPTGIGWTGNGSHGAGQSRIAGGSTDVNLHRTAPRAASRRSVRARRGFRDLASTVVAPTTDG